MACTLAHPGWVAELRPRLQPMIALALGRTPAKVSLCEAWLRTVSPGSKRHMTNLGWSCSISSSVMPESHGT